MYRHRKRTMIGKKARIHFFLRLIDRFSLWCSCKRNFPGGVGLAFATGVAALLLLPLSILQAGKGLLHPLLLLAGAGVGLLSSALPYSLEMEALIHLPSR